MASDDPKSEAESKKVSIAVSGEDEKILRGYYDKLVAGATIEVPFESAPWGDTFGMLTDKFGVRWMINAVKPKAQQQLCGGHKRELRATGAE